MSECLSLRQQSDLLWSSCVSSCENGFSNACASVPGSPTIRNFDVATPELSEVCESHCEPLKENVNADVKPEAFAQNFFSAYSVLCQDIYEGLFMDQKMAREEEIHRQMHRQGIAGLFKPLIWNRSFAGLPNGYEVDEEGLVYQKSNQIFYQFERSLRTYVVLGKFQLRCMALENERRIFVDATCPMTDTSFVYPYLKGTEF